jgi:hypothetical protein
MLDIVRHALACRINFNLNAAKSYQQTKVCCTFLQSRAINDLSA